MSYSQTQAFTLTAQASGVQATAARQLTDTMAVQVHMNYNAQWSGASACPYGNTTLTINALNYLNPLGVGTGIYTVRDTTLYSNATTAQQAIGAAGYKFAIYMAYDSAHNGATYSQQFSITNTLLNAGYVRIIEGPLEVDGFGLIGGTITYKALNGTTYSGWQAPVAFQQDVWNQWHTSATIALFSLAVPNDGLANSPAVTAASQLGVPLTSVCHWGNVHFYQSNGNAADSPSNGQLSGVITTETGYTPGIPYAITEAGFNDHSPQMNGYDGIPVVNAKYTLNQYMDAFFHNCKLLVYYELFDENITYVSTSAFQSNWGLFNANGTMKQAAVALRNFFKVMSDNGATANTFSPSKLNYTVSTLPSGGRQKLFQRSDGTFVLVIWINANIYTNGSLSTAPSFNITVTTTTPANVKTYDPMLNAATLAGTSPTGSDTTDGGLMTTQSSVTSTTVSVSDHPILITFA